MLPNVGALAADPNVGALVVDPPADPNVGALAGDPPNCPKAPPVFAAVEEDIRLLPKAGGEPKG